MKSLLVKFTLVISVLGALLSPGLLTEPTLAAVGANDIWTQMYNNDWPNGSSNPNCSPCQQWPLGDYSVTWYDQVSGPSWARTAAQAAVADWSGQPYRSPYFAETSNSGSASLTISVASLASDLCGQTVDNSDSVLSSSVVYLNSNARYTDGSTAGSSAGCDIRDTLHHEVGHSFGLGHSSDRASVMYYQNNNVETIGQDEQTALNYLYGPADSNDPCNPCQSPTTGPEPPYYEIGVLRLKLSALEMARKLSTPDPLKSGYPW